MRLLFIGDIIGEPGRHAVNSVLPRMKESRPCIDFVIANGENTAGGKGITKDTANALYRAGVHAITLGNHVWSKKEVYGYLDEEPRIVRPANYPDGAPGRGWAVYKTANGVRIGVVNLCGRVFMENLDDPFRTADKILETLRHETDVILVDFHAEATSEKIALGWHLAGRVTAVVGTHTHVQTADERILPGGTAYITDAGMAGPMDSVIGMRKELIVGRFLTNLPTKFEVADGDTRVCGVIVDVDPSTGKATDIKRFAVNPSQDVLFTSC